MLGAVGSGHFADIDEAVRAMVAIDHTIYPENDTSSLYQDLFSIFRQAYEANAKSGVYAAVYNFQKQYF